MRTIQPNQMRSMHHCRHCFHLACSPLWRSASAYLRSHHQCSRLVSDKPPTSPSSPRWRQAFNLAAITFSDAPPNLLRPPCWRNAFMPPTSPGLPHLQGSFDLLAITASTTRLRPPRAHLIRNVPQIFPCSIDC